MINLGLIGWPLSHSVSPILHRAALESVGLKGDYSLFPVDPAEIGNIETLLEELRGGNLSGLNITIPYKQEVAKLVDKLTPIAEEIGAVNTVYLKDDLLVGDNTDCLGFKKDLLAKSGLDVNKKGTVIVLGSGGAARAVVWLFLEMSWNITIASRNLAKATIWTEKLAKNQKLNLVHLDAESLNLYLDKASLIVNTTPVGMFPEIDFTPWPNELKFPSEAFVYDVIYNPQKTRLITSAEKAGLKTASGLGMLVEQAALAFEIWTNRIPSREMMFAAAQDEMNRFISEQNN